MVGGAPLNSQRNDLPGLGVGLLLEAGLDLLDLHGRFVGDVLLQLLEQVALGLLGGKAGNFLQNLHLFPLQLLGLRLGGLQLGKTVGQVLFLLLHVLRLAVQILFLLLQPALLLLQVGPALLLLPLVFVAGLQDLLLGLHQRLPLFALRALVGLVDDALGLLLGRADLLLGRLLPPLDSNRDADGQADYHAYHADDCRDGIGYHVVTYTSNNIVICRSGPPRRVPRENGPCGTCT